jgi:hypothetical protein
MKAQTRQPMIRIISRRHFEWRGWKTEIAVELNSQRLFWMALLLVALWRG